MKTLTAFYDLTLGPISYDFVTWLVRAMLERQRRQCDRLHVVIVPYEEGVGGFSRDWGGHDEAQARWRLWHIVMAACPLARATVTLAASEWQAKDIDARSEVVWWPHGKAHFMGPLVTAARAGETIPRLKATDQARRYVCSWLSQFKRPYATLTLRKQAGDPARNSNVEAWTAIEQLLTLRGFHVIRLDDSNEALARGIGYAELDPDLRLALYEQAQLNLTSNTGPQELLKFSTAPYHAFGQAISDGWRDHFRRYFGLEPGDQLPWAQPDQRLVYEPETFDTIRRAVFGDR